MVLLQALDAKLVAALQREGRFRKGILADGTNRLVDGTTGESERDEVAAKYPRSGERGRTSKVNGVVHIRPCFQIASTAFHVQILCAPHVDRAFLRLNLSGQGAEALEVLAKVSGPQRAVELLAEVLLDRSGDGRERIARREAVRECVRFGVISIVYHQGNREETVPLAGADLLRSSRDRGSGARRAVQHRRIVKVEGLSPLTVELLAEALKFGL